MASVAPTSSIKTHVRLFTDTSDPVPRKVVVKYYLDRPGYDMAHSSARIWKDPPATCSPTEIADFLDMQGIKLIDDDTMLVEVYLDAYKAFMLLDACMTGKVLFDFSDTTANDPGFLNIRLTDLVSGEQGEINEVRTSGTPFCSTSPVGLFAFALTVILAAAELFGRLVPGTVDPSFVLTWGPYGFWVSGVLQLIVGMFEAARNNVYGATAFMAFGSFWLANGTKLIFKAYFPDQIPDELRGSDPGGSFIRNFYILAFVCVLFKQTLIMNKLSSILIGSLICLLFATCFAPWSVAFEWIQLICSIFVSLWSFFAFTSEFTNEVYHKEIYNVWPWTQPTGDEDFGQVFAAAGRSTTLYSHAAKLRSASILPATNQHALRMAMGTKEQDPKSA